MVVQSQIVVEAVKRAIEVVGSMCSDGDKQCEERKVVEQVDNIKKKKR